MVPDSFRGGKQNGMQPSTMLFVTIPRVSAEKGIPVTFKLVGPAANLGARHGLVVLGAQRNYSDGCLVCETTVKGGMSFERVLISYGPLGNISASSGLLIFLDMRDRRPTSPVYCILVLGFPSLDKNRFFCRFTPV